jgi:EmrB/QacA subfamily drug resistance transporter
MHVPPVVSEPWLLAMVALGTMLAPLNSTMIAVALPGIMGEFQATTATAGWLVTGYLVVMAALQPVAGKLGDRLGRRWMLAGGLTCFGVTSLAAATATSLPMLVAMRMLQAAGGAVALPNATALVRELVPVERRGRQMGLVGSAIAMAAAFGPPLGGALVGWIGWRAIFFANLPLAVAAVAICLRVVPAGSGRRPSQRFDLGGTLLLPALLAATALCLSVGIRQAPPVVLGAWVLALVAGAVLFVYRELRHPDPVLQPRLFRRRGFAASNATVALSNLAFYVTLLVIPILLAQRPEWTSVQTGLVLTALSAATIVCAPVGGWLADRRGRRVPVVAGLVLMTAGLLALPLLGAGIGLAALLPALGLAGLGLGVAQAGVQTAALESVEPQFAGVASGVYSTSRYFGSIVGSSAMAGLLGARPNASGFTAVFVMIAVGALFSTGASVGLEPRARTAA